MNNFENTILKLHRQYDKDEIVGLLRQRVKTLEFEIGLLKSDNAELEHNLVSQILPEGIDGDTKALYDKVNSLQRKVKNQKVQIHNLLTKLQIYEKND